MQISCTTCKTRMEALDSQSSNLMFKILHRCMKSWIRTWEQPVSNMADATVMSRKALLPDRLHDLLEGSAAADEPSVSIPSSPRSSLAQILGSWRACTLHGRNGSKSGGYSRLVWLYQQEACLSTFSKQGKSVNRDGNGSWDNSCTNLEVVSLDKPSVMSHRQLHIIQQDEICQIDLEPIAPCIARFQHSLQHL